ncbi:ESX secretion-associated protein EspG [Pseudonocardia sp. HH130630-07]|uniref:ESX secretion-associated protein EspG n=1 Tax=Pseudonocardia sp. HH130630-07 TaxID=1690815 RepID=UPI000814F20A|nr:ESX secretion-associated protein EspG [Pseudonocardia sp. HH130630-07]ANY05627.1 hypothetical protein AFB00_04150 [Pseudonocardia sp. HH130630-07]
MTPAPDWSRATVLSGTELDVARELLGFGPGPAVLGLVSPGPTTTERDRLVRDVTAGLQGRGLVRDGRPVPGLAEELEVLLRPDARREVTVDEPHRQRAVVATRDRRAVLAARVGEEIALLRVDPARASAALVALLGPVVPGHGAPVRIPYRILLDVGDACAGDRSRLTAELLRRGASGTETALVNRMGECYALAEFGAASVGPRGPRRASSFLLAFATPTGWYYQSRPAPARLGGRPADTAVVRCGPADAGALAAELDTLARAC